MPEPHENRRLLADTLAGAAAQFGALAIAFLLAPLLIRTLGEQPYGAYVLATSVVSLLLLLQLLLGIFVGTVAVTLHEGPPRLAALLLRGSRYVAAIVAPVAVLLAVLARPLLVGWLGPAFAASEVPTILLTTLQALLASLSVGHTIVVATGRLHGRLPVMLGAAGLNLMLSLLWVRRWGMTGVALGTVVAALIDYPLHLRYLSRHVGLRYGAFMREVVLPVYPLLLLPAALAWAARAGGFTTSLAGALLTFAMAALLYWMAFLMLMVSRVERDGLIATARGLIARREAVGR